MLLPPLLNQSDKRLKILCTLLLLIQLLNSMKVSATPLTQDEVDSLLGSRQELSRQEVAELMSNILTDADEEIARTAQEAAREVSASDAGEISFQKSLADSWKKEADKIDRSRGRWRNVVLVETAIILGGSLVLYLTK